MGRDLHFRPRGDHTRERGLGTTYNIHFLVLVFCLFYFINYKSTLNSLILHFWPRILSQFVRMKIFNKFRLGATIAVRQLQSVTKHASPKELRDGRKLSNGWEIQCQSQLCMRKFRVHWVQVVFSRWHSFLHNLLIFGPLFFKVKSCRKNSQKAMKKYYILYTTRF